MKHLVLTCNSRKRQVQSLHLLDHVHLLELLASGGAEQREIPTVETLTVLLFRAVSVHGERFLLRSTFQHGPRAALVRIPACAGVRVDENVLLD